MIFRDWVSASSVLQCFETAGWVTEWSIWNKRWKTSLPCRWQTRATQGLRPTVLYTYVDGQCDKLVTEIVTSLSPFLRNSKISVEYRRLNLRHLYLATPLGVIPLEFRRNFWRQKTRVTGLSYGVVCMILRLAVLVQCRLVTDRQTDQRTDTWRQHIPR